MTGSIGDKTKSGLHHAHLWLKGERRGKIVLASFILLAIMYLLFLTPSNETYNEEVAKEVALARRMCVASTDWALKNRGNLNALTKSLKGKIKVDGKEVVFKYIEYPHAELLYKGRPHPEGLSDLHKGVSLLDYYCIFNDPRGRAENYTGNYYYDYNRGVWVDFIGFRK